MKLPESLPHTKPYPDSTRFVCAARGLPLPHKGTVACRSCPPPFFLGFWTFLILLWPPLTLSSWREHSCPLTVGTSPHGVAHPHMSVYTHSHFQITTALTCPCALYLCLCIKFLTLWEQELEIEIETQFSVTVGFSADFSLRSGQGEFSKARLLEEVDT